jgi:hypothetical protein
MQRRGFGRKSAVPVGFTKEEAEAALAYYWKDNLAKFLLNVIDNFKPPANMDIKLLYVALPLFSLSLICNI